MSLNNNKEGRKEGRESKRNALTLLENFVVKRNGKQKHRQKTKCEKDEN